MGAGGIDKVKAALAATKVPNGRLSPFEEALESLPDDERDAWVAVLSDHSIPAQWVHRALTHAGVDAGATDSSVKTWRRNHPNG